MEQLLKEYAPYVFSLISVLVGALVSFFSTIFIENIRMKREIKKVNFLNIWRKNPIHG